MSAKFEKVSKYADIDLPIPTRGTENAAGYDFVVAEDVEIPPYTRLYNMLQHHVIGGHITLNELAKMTKERKAKPTLVSTGMKCYLEPDTYLELSARSSTPLKYWLVVANGVGRLFS